MNKVKRYVPRRLYICKHGVPPYMIILRQCQECHVWWNPMFTDVYFKGRKCLPKKLLQFLENLQKLQDGIPHISVLK